MHAIAMKKKVARLMSLLVAAGAFGAALLLLGFILQVVGQGIAGFSMEILLDLRDMFFNTLYLVLLALVFSTLWGVPAGIYLAEYAKDGKVVQWVRMAVETLASLPSIVVGLFGYLVFIVMTGSQWNLLAGALSVSILTLPLMTSVTENALKDLPPEYTMGSLGLGASRWQTIWHVLLPACYPRIETGMILAAGRGLGETAALLFTAGMSTDIDWGSWNLASSTCALNPLRPGETLALHIWVMRTEALAPDAAQVASVTSALLMLIVVGFTIVARYFCWRMDRNREGTSHA